MAGVIYIPLKDVFYFAAEGLGSFRLDTSDPLSSGLLDVIIKGSVTLPITNDQSPIRRVPSRLTVIGSRSHMSSETEQFINSLRAEHGEVDLISAGSSLKFCLIAEGKADVYPRFAPTMEWDTGAGQAIVEQAGGKVVRADDGEPLIYNKENLLNPWFTASGKQEVTIDPIFELFQHLVDDQGKTIVMVTHDQSLAPRFSRTMQITDGELDNAYETEADNKSSERRVK